MALYEITQDCRIANKEYLKWDIVSNNEVGGYYPTIMKATEEGKVNKKEGVKEEVKENEVIEEVEGKVEEKPAKKQRKKK